MLHHEQRCIRQHLGSGINLRFHNAVHSPLPPSELSAFHGVIFGGSGDFSVSDPSVQSWLTPMLKVLEKILTDGTPGFGLCFGHQLLGRILGAPVETDPETAELGTIEVELTDAGAKDPVFGVLSSPFSAHTGHSDAVLGVPSGVTLLARNPHLATQAFRVDGRPFFSTQFHPDLTGLQAQERYQAYQELLLGPDRAPTEVHFIPGLDDTTKLLNRFAQLVRQHCAEGSLHPPVA
jgi:GMP synthase (glutamine-hydrolysing)